MEGKPIWSVVIVYENNAARDEATRFCNQLVEKFWSQCEFDLSWLSFEKLHTLKFATEAARKAAEADLVIFSAQPEGDMPIAIEAWIEHWLSQRREREGALVGLLGQQPGRAPELAGKHVFLRRIANRAGMDYLTQVPETFGYPIPDSIESCADRAHRVTGVLDEILHQQPAPPTVKL
jgi:hypothetical protein